MIMLGDADVYFDEEGHLVTVYQDGRAVQAHPQNTDAYRATASELGYSDALGVMCREHELTHHLLALWFGRRFSPSIRAVSLGRPEAGSELEEAAVLAVQRYARSIGVDLEQVARQHHVER